MSENHGAQQSQLQKFFTKAPVRGGIILICFLWSVPTLGMLISSFRVPDEINRSGWWTVLTARENPAYTSLVKNVEFFRTPITNRVKAVEEAQSALEAGPTEENLADARAELESGLQDAVDDAQRDLDTAQASLADGDEGAEDDVAAAEEALAEAQAALDAGVNDDEVRTLAIQELEMAVTSAQNRLANIDTLEANLEESQRTVEFFSSPIANRTKILEDAQAALEAGPTEENLADTREELESGLQDAVDDAQRALDTAQAALADGDEGAADEVTAAEEALAEAQAALDTGVSDEEVEALAIQELEAAVTRQQTVIDNLTVRLEESQQKVEFFRTPITNRMNALEDAQAALEAGPTEENLADAREELESPLHTAVAAAERELEDAQEALDESIQGAEDEVTAAEEVLAEAQAAIEAGVSDDEVRTLAIQELEMAVTSAQNRLANIDTLEANLEESQRALAETDEPESFPLFSKGWREQWTTDNYEKVLDADGMSDAFINSLLVTIPSVVIPITIAAFAAYAFAWLNFPFKDWLFALVIISMGVPLHLALVPILELYLDLDLGGTYMGVWLAHTGFGLPLAIYLIYGYMITVPRDIMESASIDGASMFTSFTRLVLPLSIPVIAAFAIFQFLWVWNDLLLALVFLGTDSDNIVLTAKLTELVGSKGQDWEVLTAGAFITMAMPLAIFFALQRFFVRGLTAGSVKG